MLLGLIEHRDDRATAGIHKIFMGKFRNVPYQTHAWNTDYMHEK